MSLGSEHLRVTSPPPPSTHITYHHALSFLLACSLMVINFDDFVQDTQGVVTSVLKFIGADPARLQFKPLPPGMKVGKCSARVWTWRDWR